MRGMSHAAHARLAHSEEEAARRVAAPAIPQSSPKKKTPFRSARGNGRQEERGLPE